MYLFYLQLPVLVSLKLSIYRKLENNSSFGIFIRRSDFVDT